MPLVPLKEYDHVDMLPAMPGDSNFLEDTIFTLSDIWYNIYVIHRNGLQESFFSETHLQKLM